MLRPIDNYFLQHEEPINSCLQFLREHILKIDKNVSEAWLYGMPFFYYKGKRFCYLWVHKKYKQPYLGFVDGNLLNNPALISENRTRMKIFLINTERHIPVKEIDSILKEAIALCTSRRFI